jgi:hypothetical protein
MLMEVSEINIGKILKDYLPAIAITVAIFAPLILKNPSFGIYLICFLIPISPSISIGETDVRDITLRFEDIFFIITLVSWGIRGFYIPKDGYGSRIAAIILFFAFIYSISTFLFLSPFRWKAQLLFLSKFIQYWLYFIMSYSLLKSEKEIKNVIIAYFLGVSIALIYWLNSIILEGKIGNAVRFPFHTRFGGRENVGIFALGIMTIAFPFMLKAKGIKKLLFPIIFASATLVYFRTLSRASYLAGVVWLLFQIFFMRRKDVFIISLILTAAFPFIVPDYVIERIKYTFEGSGGGEIIGNIYVESSAFVRWDRWRWFITDQLPESPIFGFGMLGVGLMDNQFFRVWGETGTLGLIVFIYLIYTIWKFLKMNLKSNYEDKNIEALSLGITGWFVGILAHALGANTFVILQTAEMFWLLLGTVASAERLQKHKIIQTFTEKSKNYMLTSRNLAANQ